MKTLLVIVLLVGVVGASKNSKLKFNVTFICDIPGIKEWCVSAFFSEIDYWSPDEPIMWFQQCSHRKRLNVVINAGRPGGDGLWAELQSFYEINWNMYHSCTWKNAENNKNDPKDCECDIATSDMYVDYSKTTDREDIWVNPLVYWPTYPRQTTLRSCVLPRSFERIPRQKFSYIERIYWGADLRCTWRLPNGTHRDPEYWTAFPDASYNDM